MPRKAVKSFSGSVYAVNARFVTVFLHLLGRNTSDHTISMYTYSRLTESKCHPFSATFDSWSM